MSFVGYVLSVNSFDVTDSFTGKAELVKEIIVNLANAVKAQQGSRGKHEDGIWMPLPVERFMEHDAVSTASKVVVPRKQYNQLFAGNNQGSDA